MKKVFFLLLVIFCFYACRKEGNGILNPKNINVTETEGSIEDFAPITGKVTIPEH